MHFWYILLTFCIVYFFAGKNSYGQKSDTMAIAQMFKSLTMEQLMNMEVTSVSKHPEKLTGAASSIQVITNEDIRRSGATNLPEALQLATNLQVSHFASNAWIISARGFNAIFANKLLVLIDGRNIYSPLFAGVLWDVQSVLLEDVERIEVISGPGGTLWGANAVNGVINIITKKADQTQGFYYSRAAGSHLKNLDALRYGGKLGDKLSYRVFAQHSDRNNTISDTGEENTDFWGLTHGGVRLDWDLGTDEELTIQGNVYDGSEKTLPKRSTYDGQNILGRYSKIISERTDFMVQAYYDRTWRRDIPSTISDQLQTFDIESQLGFRLGKSHRFTWGMGYRFMESITLNASPIVGILPNKRNMPVYHTFIQDEINLIPDLFKLTLGTKLQHNVFSEFELQPSARINFTPGKSHNIWAAVSRAVRTPSRIDADYYAPTFDVPANQFSVRSGADFTSEKLIAYELGYRVQPVNTLSLSLALFFNAYDDLFSVEPIPGTLTFITQNGSEGYTSGQELAMTWQIFDFWRLRGGYTYFWKDLKSKEGHDFDTESLGYDAEHQALAQSMLTLFKRVNVDIVARYRSGIESLEIPEYFTFDARIAWQAGERLELSIVGQNLFEEQHIEINDYIARSIYGRLTFRL